MCVSFESKSRCYLDRNLVAWCFQTELLSTLWPSRTDSIRTSRSTVSAYTHPHTEEETDRNSTVFSKAESTGLCSTFDTTLFPSHTAAGYVMITNPGKSTHAVFEWHCSVKLKPWASLFTSRQNAHHNRIWAETICISLETRRFKKNKQTTESCAWAASSLGNYTSKI